MLRNWVIAALPPDRYVFGMQNSRSSLTPAHGVSFADAFWVWLRIAALSFGGPAGQIAVMHRILVDEKKWVSESRFLHALNYCMLLPGPEAQQLATYIGWLMHRTAGGVMAGGLFILPGVISIMGLSWIYALWGETTLIAGLFFGMKAAVLAIVIEAVIRVGRRSLKTRAMQALDMTQPVRLTVLTAGSQVLPGDVARKQAHNPALNPAQALALGPCRVIAQELPQVSARLVDVLPSGLKDKALAAKEVDLLAV